MLPERKAIYLSIVDAAVQVGIRVHSVYCSVISMIVHNANIKAFKTLARLIVLKLLLKD